MIRYAAKLLFQFRVEIDGDPGKRRVCEERIVHFGARSPAAALAAAERRGKRAKYASENDEGNPVRFEFVGIVDMMTFGAEAGADEVWYEIRERLMPMERRATLLPTRQAIRDRLVAGAGHRITPPRRPAR